MNLATTLVLLSASISPAAPPEQPPSVQSVFTVDTSESPQFTGVEVHQGVLAFRDAQTFERVSQWAQSLDPSEANAWEERMGFLSQRRLFDQVVEAEYEIYQAPYETLSEQELQHLPAPSGHSAVYQRCLALGVIRETEDSYEYGISSPALARLIDEHGFYVVGNVLCQAQGPYSKEWRGATLQDRPELDAATVSDVRRGLVVVDAGPEAMSGPFPPPPAGTSGSFDKSTGWVTAGSRRGLLRVIYTRTMVGYYPYPQVITHYDVNVQSQRKTWWGHWYYPSCPNECWISGSWISRFDLISLSTLAYVGAAWGQGSWAYSHPNCINNFWGSFSPLTGANVGYGTGFIYTAPLGTGFLEASISPMLWKASVPGGSSGINLQITN